MWELFPPKHLAHTARCYSAPPGRAMVIAVMNTEKIAVFATATMVPWHPTSPAEGDPHIQGAGDPWKGEPARFQNQSAGFFGNNLWKILLPNHF